MHVIIVKPRSLKQNVKPIFNTSTNFFHSFYIFIFEKQIFSVFDAKNKMVLDPENFMRRSDEFAHSKATLHKFIALSPQQADGVITMNKNFINFVFSHFKEWEKDFSEKEFREFLSSIYKIRSLCTHEGENFEQHIKLVNRLGSKSVFTTIGNKDLEFPGLNYLSNLVRTVLINFLNKQESSETDNIPKLALKNSIVNLTLQERMQKETIQRGTFITKDKIKYRD